MTVVDTVLRQGFTRTKELHDEGCAECGGDIRAGDVVLKRERFSRATVKPVGFRRVSWYHMGCVRPAGEDL